MIIKINLKDGIHYIIKIIIKTATTAFIGILKAVNFIIKYKAVSAIKRKDGKMMKRKDKNLSAKPLSEKSVFRLLKF